MGKLLHYLKGYAKESILGPLFKLLEASFELLIPIVMAHIIDEGIRNRDMTYILQMGAIIIALGVIGLVCSITAQYFAAKAAVGFATALRYDLFRHIQSLSYSEMDTIGTSTLITRMTSDINQVQSGLNLVLRLFLRSPFIVFGSMIMAFTINVRAALVFVVTIPLLSVVVFGVMIISMPLYRNVQNRLDKVLLHTRENLAGARVIRAFNKEVEEKKDFEQANDFLVKGQIFVGKISALMNPLTYVIINGALAVLIWTGAWQVEDGIISQGQVVALVSYMSQILVELVKLANLIINITRSLACANRIQAVFETKPGMAPGAGAAEDAHTDDMVVFDDVSFTYDKASEPSLSHVSFTVKRGQTIGIIGGTGSGKTSLVNLIPRFYDATQGKIFVEGNDISSYTFRQLRDEIGVVPQKAVLFKGTIAENLRWGRKEATREEMLEALEAAQALEFVEKKDKGLDSVILQDGSNLSGGQRQRLTIARALIRKPKILILDDSASALDYATDAKLRKAIKNLDKKMTVFIVSQRTASIWHADQIIVLDDGQVAGIGTHDELLKHCDVYQEIYYSQFPKEENPVKGEVAHA
ncbi:ABC-type multidrug transport system fused ATPase/permease subunit [Catenibacillus scindens]|uniref:ABC-type multidrug transport system fused ATPase/permease subunit n=1 Tax=Catenibacillus scindens TaxID=673271 RepID=A0A7W8HBV5_9FIRM|nr:ABC transporter ATP-binding protein [Catenibacillus scindens]MBB5264837.1 ABC-type multidrug transport system fused ATPase/permease subunit [Catenibacillus scindens]